MTSTQRTAWWRDAIVYQVWPKSFYSARGTPTGDIAGVICKLDYLKALGINTVWLSPHYASPMIDEGYDISDYQDVNPDFGTLADADALIRECHARDMRIIFDLVINHSSDQHAWFKESRSSVDNAKRDWYIWRPAKYDADGSRMPPNNWGNFFYESAWTWDEATQMYYFHLFAKEQPELNWTNDECRAALFESAVEFWLKRGVDGFRVDTASLYSKPMDFPDAAIVDPHSFIQPPHALVCDGPMIHEYVQQLGCALAPYDAMAVGEYGSTDEVQKILNYVSFARNELSMVFRNDVCDVGKDGTLLSYKEWTLNDLRNAVDVTQRYVEGTDGWTTAVMENHDIGRSVSRFASDDVQHRAASAKMLSLLHACLSGTPFIYQGQELGMTNVPLAWDLSEYKDVQTIKHVERFRAKGAHTDDEIERMKQVVNLQARDNARTPMQWSAGPNAGFTAAGVTPWMRVNDNYVDINAEQQLDDKGSVLHFWRRALALRKGLPSVFVYGTFRLRDTDNKHVFTFVKTAIDGSAKAIVFLNFSADVQAIKLPSEESDKGLRVALSNVDATDAAAALQPYEGRVVVCA